MSETGTYNAAIEQVQQMIEAGELDLALEQTFEIMKVAKADPRTSFLQAMIYRRQGKLDKAQAKLERLAEDNEIAGVYQELGYVFHARKDVDHAIDALRKAVKLDPRLHASWRLLGQLLSVENHEDEAEEAYRQFLVHTNQHPLVVKAVEYVAEGKLGLAEGICKEYLKRFPEDVTVIRLLAEIGLKVEANDDAKLLLERCLELAPEFHLARNNYANALGKAQEFDAALRELDYLEKVDAGNLAHSVLAASILVRIGEYQKAIDRYSEILKEAPNHALLQMSYGHALKTVGRQQDAITAYQRAIKSNPALGEAYWSLANLKTYRFSDDEIQTMKRVVDSGECTPRDYFHLCFSLGKALEDAREYDDAFEFYLKGNDVKQEQSGYDADANTASTDRLIATCTKALFEGRENAGCDAPDPIFIVGLPRSGSTLLEQILASHSMVDGTSELPNIQMAARRLGGKVTGDEVSAYPDILAELTEEQCRELGEEYIEQTRIQRQNAPLFIDKMPNNFAHVGLIRLILPNAKIIDARRSPMATCFSGFKQLFAAGQTFTYGLENIGRYYADYVRLMAHYDAVLPGFVHRVQYEEMIADTEGETRRLLDYCGLPFEPQCLEFYKTDRPVRTASSEQVRQPIYRDAVEQWKHFESHLEPLRRALAGQSS